MGEPKISHNPQLYLTIGQDGAEGPDVGFMFEKFEWKSFTNGGYIIRARLRDPYWNILKNIATKFYLDKGRRKQTKVFYELIWPGLESTGKHLAYMTDMDARGINAGGFLEFVAVDPPSYWLNAGDSSGRVYKGKASQVIKKVIEDYFVKPNGSGKVEVSDTVDSEQNLWYMMRMDPKTFIASILDWSSSLTVKKTNWIVSSDGAVDRGEPTIWVKEQAMRESINYGVYVLDVKTPSSNDIANFEFLSDNFISVFQKQLITQGLSAVSGKYFDRRTDTPPHTGQDSQCVVHVHDENTSNKKNVSIDSTRGFAKPRDNPSDEKPHEWSTSIASIPQDNAGNIGVPYSKYIDGRSRQQFLNMLNLVMRLKIRVFGETMRELANSHNLGVSRLKVAWIDADDAPYFLDGDWLVYGFHHIVTRGTWYTDIYCVRLDYDAEAEKLSASKPTRGKRGSFSF